MMKAGLLPEIQNHFGGTRSNLALFIILIISLSKTWEIHAGISAMRAHTQKYKRMRSLSIMAVSASLFAWLSSLSGEDIVS